MGVYVSRLLSQNGIPKLRRVAKSKLKFKGKGHEVYTHTPPCHLTKSQVPTNQIQINADQ